jgi:hypothetical protein
MQLHWNTREQHNVTKIQCANQSCDYIGIHDSSSETRKRSSGNLVMVRRGRSTRKERTAVKLPPLMPGMKSKTDAGGGGTGWARGWVVVMLGVFT